MSDTVQGPSHQNYPLEFKKILFLRKYYWGLCFMLLHWAVGNFLMLLRAEIDKKGEEGNRKGWMPGKIPSSG